MGLAKCRIESMKKNPRAIHSTSYKEFLKKFRRFTDLPALIVILPPKTSTDFIANHYRNPNPVRRPDTNQDIKQRISNKEELVALNKKIEEVQARIKFLQSESKKNADNSSHQ